MFALFGLSMVVSILLCVHAVRTGQEQFWLWILLMFHKLFSTFLDPGALHLVFQGARALEVSL